MFVPYVISTAVGVFVSVCIYAQSNLGDSAHSTFVSMLKPVIHASVLLPFSLWFWGRGPKSLTFLMAVVASVSIWLSSFSVAILLAVDTDSALRLYGQPLRSQAGIVLHYLPYSIPATLILAAVARLVFREREQRIGQPPLRFTLRDVLLLTLIIAIILAALRWSRGVCPYWNAWVRSIWEWHEVAFWYGPWLSPVIVVVGVCSVHFSQQRGRRILLWIFAGSMADALTVCWDLFDPNSRSISPIAIAVQSSLELALVAGYTWIVLRMIDRVDDLIRRPRATAVPHIDEKP
jgi:hypothetical protein